MSIAEDREAVLLARIERLSNDVEAIRKVLERTMDDRNRWRQAYQDLHRRVELLAAVKASVAEVANG
jgi:ribosomal 50S subunit-associated protein YjgA (DUF615 family)